ncbi:MAG: hypothetical protein QOJ07_2895 [Thermoleophilaceae bacterium]|jgi:hypothetical protein|nr:hypothetical protein [Thermoleophilaceae bacterium]
MSELRRIWWPLPGKLCLLERPGGGGRSHRPQRRAEEVDHLARAGVRLVVSTMTTRHNLSAYDEAGLAWVHVPVASCEAGADALAEIVALLKRELRRRGAVAVHGNRMTDFVAAVGVAYMRDVRGVDPAESLAEAERAGLRPTPACVELLGLEPVASSS